MDVAVEGVGCAGCIRKIESGLKQVPGSSTRGSTSPTAGSRCNGVSGEIDAGAVIDALERIGYHGHPFETANAEADESRHARWLLRCLAVAGFAAMNIMLLSVSVWSGNASDITQETRDFFHWLSAFDRVADGRLCRPAVLSERLARAAGAAGQHGRADIARRHAGASACRWWRPPITPSTPISTPPSCCCSSCCAAAISTTRCGSKTRAVAGNLAALKAETAHRFERRRSRDRAGRGAARPATACWCGPAIACRRRCGDQRRIGDRRKPGHGRDRAARHRRRRHGLCRQREFLRRADVAGDRRRHGTLIDEIERLMDKAVEAKSRYVRLADRAARLYAPVVHTAAALTAAGWLVAGRLAARCRSSSRSPC